MRKGDKVVMNNEALDNYGYEYKNVIFKIVHVANKTMSPKEFYAKEMPDGYHPGYDTGVYPMKLYDLETLDGEYFGNSLYGWELKKIS